MHPTEPHIADDSESRDERLARLLAKARSLAHSPGVYLMKDHAGLVL